jgi:hypothetical protein
VARNSGGALAAILTAFFPLPPIGGNGDLSAKQALSADRPMITTSAGRGPVSAACALARTGARRMAHNIPLMPVDACEVRPRRDHRGVNLISDALPFGRCGMASQTQSATRLTTRSFAAAHITL